MRFPLSARLTMLFIVSGLCLVCDVLGPRLFWQPRNFGKWTEELAFVASGGLLAQLGILSIWCALGEQRFQWRFLCTLLLSSMPCSAFIIGLQLPDYPNSSMGFWVGVLIFGIGIGCFLTSALVLKGIGLLTQERIYFDEISQGSHASSGGYSIGYLIGLTTGVALVVALVRAVMPAEQENFPPAIAMISIILIIVQHAILSILLLSSCLTIVLRERRNWHGLIWLGCLCVFALPADLFLMMQYRSLQLDRDSILQFLCYLIGFFLCSLLFLILLRVAGYRLKRVDR